MCIKKGISKAGVYGRAIRTWIIDKLRNKLQCKGVGQPPAIMTKLTHQSDFKALAEEQKHLQQVLSQIATKCLKWAVEKSNINGHVMHGVRKTDVSTWGSSYNWLSDSTSYVEKNRLENEGQIWNITIFFSLAQQLEVGQGLPSDCRHKAELVGVAWSVLRWSPQSIIPVFKTI